MTSDRAGAAGVIVTEVGEGGRPLAARVDPPTEELIQRLRDDAAALTTALDRDLAGSGYHARRLTRDVQTLLARLTLSIAGASGDATHPGESITRRVTCWELGDGRLADGWVGIETRECGGVHGE